MTDKIFDRTNASLIDEWVKSVFVYGNVEIENKAFWFFSALEEIEFLGHITKIGNNAFTDEMS